MYIKSRNTFFATASLALFVTAASLITKQNQRPKNLQILPKDISNEKLDSIMHTYNTALGVKCEFCHENANKLTFGLDYSSDAGPMKITARKMLDMTIGLNKTWFWFNKEERPEYLKVITCNTCHRGEAFPEQ
jgi:hypothetical protein